MRYLTGRLAEHLRGNVVAYLAAATVGPKDIEKNAVRSKHIKKKAVKSKHVKPGSVGSAQIGKGAVGSEQLSGGAVGPGQIKNGAVTRQKIAPDSVGASEADLGSLGLGPGLLYGQISGFSVAGNADIEGLARINGFFDRDTANATEGGVATMFMARDVEVSDLIVTTATAPTRPITFTFVRYEEDFTGGTTELVGCTIAAGNKSCEASGSSTVQRKQHLGINVASGQTGVALNDPTYYWGARISATG